MVSDGELIDLYKTNFLITKNHGITITEIENMIPYEREIYIMIILDYLEREKRARHKHGTIE